MSRTINPVNLAASLSRPFLRRAIFTPAVRVSLSPKVTVSRHFSTCPLTQFAYTPHKMGVHNLAEYVKYHQEKLRKEQQAQSSTSSTVPAQSTSGSSATTTTTPKKRAWTGVLTLGSQSAFKSQVLSADPGKLVVLDCFATWCGPCKAIAPKVVEMSNQYTDVLFAKFDVDEVPEVAQELGIRAMPTFLFFKNGEKVDELVGANPNKLNELVQKWM